MTWDFEALYLEHLAKMRAFAKQRLSDPGDVEDLLQELFLRLALRLRSGVDEKFNPQIWLYIVLRNLCISAARRKAYRQRHEMEPVYETEDGPQVDTSILALEAKEGDPERELETKTMRERMRHAVAGLTLRERRALSFRLLHDMSHEEVAERTGQSASATHNAIRHARYKVATRYRALEASA